MGERMGDLVICHVYGDARLAEEIAGGLRAAGYAVWLPDGQSLLRPAGDPDRVAARIDAAAAVLALISGAALSERDFDTQVDRAFETGRPLLAVLRDASRWELELRRPAWTRALGERALTLTPAGVAALLPELLAALAESGVSPEPGQASAASASFPTEPPKPAPPYMLTDVGILRPAAEPSPESATPSSMPLPPLELPPPPAALAAPAPGLSSPSSLDPAPAGSSISPPRSDAAPEVDEVSSPEWAAPADVEPTEEPAAPPPASLSATAMDSRWVVVPVEAEPDEAAEREVEPTVDRSGIVLPPAAPRATAGPTVVEGRAPLPPVAPRPARRGGCGCLAWALFIFIGLPILIGVVGFVALVFFALFNSDSESPPPEATPAPAAIATAATVAIADGTAIAGRPSPTPARTATIRAPAPTLAGQRVLRDTFAEPGLGLLPAESDAPDRYHRGYDQGEYVLSASRSTSPPPVLAAPASGAYGDVTVVVDARLIGETTGRTLIVACRDQGSAAGAGYGLLVSPNRGQAALARWDAGRATMLVDWRTTAAVRRGLQTNRLELRCHDGSITALVNGAQVASIRDSTYPAGVIWLGVSENGGPSPTTEARFDNLAVTGVPVSS
jgi:hypothetical protein